MTKVVLPIPKRDVGDTRVLLQSWTINTPKEQEIDETITQLAGAGFQLITRREEPITASVGELSDNLCKYLKRLFRCLMFCLGFGPSRSNSFHNAVN